MNKKILFVGLASILSICALASSGSVASFAKADDDNTMLVGEATTYEEKIKVAKENLKLNINQDTVVTTLNLPSTGLYSSTITWTSSNESVITINGSYGEVTRPETDTKVTLTATLQIVDNKGNLYTDTKDFELTVLHKKEDSSSTTTLAIDEDFTSYKTGDDLSAYLRWDISSGNGLATVVDEVPNNNLPTGNKAVKIESKKTATTTSYVRSFYLTGKVAFEGYMMYTGSINGIYFDLGADDVYGPTIGITDNLYSYYSNGTRNVDAATAAPVEGVWSKFRIEANSSAHTYKAYIYKMDGSNETIQLCSSTAFYASNKFFNQLRIRSVGGSNVGAIYLYGLKVQGLDDLPVSEGTNPNRTNGIGQIDNFQESVLYINGEEKKYGSGFVVHNRFDNSQIYTEGSDYIITTDVVSTSDKKDVNQYTITLTSTGETRVLTQTVYKEDKEAAPAIYNFKGSHLARKVINKDTGELSSTGTITLTGSVTRSDGTIYYAVTKAGEAAPTAEEIIAGGTSFVTSGSVAQTSANVEVSIENLSLSNEYDVYALIKNDYGTSSIYSKTNISQVINITTCEEFYDMTINIDTYKNTFRLMNDLDFSGYNWVCDANNVLKFRGVLDGQGHTISNLSIQSPYRKAAIFYEMEDAEVKDLNFVNTNISGSQDSAVICGYSYGGSISNISLTNTTVSYNEVEGGEGYFAALIGRVQQNTIDVTNVSIDGVKITANKYAGVIAGNVNKDANAVLNIKNVYVDATFDVEGAAVGLIGRNRGTTNVDNAVIYINVLFAKKEMGILAGHNKEGGSLNVKNVIGSLEVRECTQPTYFNYFIGSQDDNTSTYTYENVYFLKGDYSSISDSITPTANARTCGVTLEQPEEFTQRWYEENTFIKSFKADAVWSYDEAKGRPVLELNKVVNVKAEDVNSYISLIKNDLSDDDYYYIYEAYALYDACSAEEKAKVNKEALDNAKAYYQQVYNGIESIIEEL